MKKWMDDLLPIILEMLQDSSSLQKREVALWTLGQLVESTGYVVEPYKQYPTLMEVVLNFLKNRTGPYHSQRSTYTLALLVRHTWRYMTYLPSKYVHWQLFAFRLFVYLV